MLLKIILGALSIVFIKATMQQGQINGWVVRLLWRAPLWIKKPLFGCLTCMTSVWGAALFFVYHTNYTILAFVGFILPLGGLLYLIDCVLTFATIAVDENEQKSQPVD